ncbi:MAG: hypothetical protein ABIP02_09955 [Arenimonas sp.]
MSGSHRHLRISYTGDKTSRHEHAVILGFAMLYKADASETALPNAAAGRSLLAQHRPDIIQRLEACIQSVAGSANVEKYLDATLLGTARLGLRHGSFGSDFHHYHNEGHILDLAERRLGRIIEFCGVAAMPAQDWLSLILFAACHDLRQRETKAAPGPVGGNEAASIAETFRILKVCGFDRKKDRADFVAMEMMIAGSTFDPRLTRINTDTSNLTGGAFSRSIGLWLDGLKPAWREDHDATRGERLGRLAADIDTANVGESFDLLGQSALQLAQEQLMRRGLNPEQAESAQPALNFLSNGQQHYFFDLHRFSSREADRVFGPQKLANSDKVRKTSAALIAHFQKHPADNGRSVMSVFESLCNRPEGKKKPIHKESACSRPGDGR